MHGGRNRGIFRAVEGARAAWREANIRVGGWVAGKADVRGRGVGVGVGGGEAKEEEDAERDES